MQYAHQVQAISDTGHILVSSKLDDSVRILDNADGGSVSVIDIAAKAEAGRIGLKSALEVPVLFSPTILAVNGEDPSEIKRADLSTGKAPATSRFAGGSTCWSPGS